MDDSTARALDRLDRAVAALLAYRDRAGVTDRAEFLAEHEDLRDLLEPMLAEPVGDGEPAHRELGDYRIVREIGRGGMGVVYEAVEPALDRRVALKVLPPHLTLAPRQIERFRREAASAARLRHPGIVSVFGAGEVDGTHFFAMELVEGDNLADLCARRGRAPDATLGVVPGASRAAEAAEITAQIADALQYAHERGVVHRDVKPHNVLVDGNARVRVVDFGLAKDSARASLTHTGAFAGTPHYASPEQLAGGTVDARSDVFSLGVVLYELISGERPYDASTEGQALVAMHSGDPRPLRAHGVRVPRDLEVICNKALERAAADRYPTAAAMGADLRRFLRHEPIEARPAGTLTRVLKAVRRRRTPAAAVAGAALVAIAAGIAFKLHDEGVTEDRLARFRSTQQSIAKLVDSLTASQPHTAAGRASVASERHRIETALAEVEELLARASDGGLAAPLRASAARLMRHAGQFFAMLREGERARKVLTRGIDLCEQRLAGGPDPDARCELAGLLHARTTLSETRDRDMPDDLRRAVELWRQILSRGAGGDVEQRARAGLAGALADHAMDLLRFAGGVAEAAAAIAQAEALWDGAAGTDQPWPVRQTRLWVTIVAAQVAVFDDRLPEAHARYLQVLAELASDGDHGRLWKIRALQARLGAACAAIGMGRPHDEVVTELRGVVEQAAELELDHAGLPGFAELLARARYMLASRLVAERQYDAALAQLDACTLDTAAAPSAIRALDLRIDAMKLLVQRITGALAGDQAHDAFARLDAAAAALATENPDAHGLQSMQGELLANHAALAASADRAAATELIRRAIACQKRAVAGAPKHPDYRRFLCLHYALLNQNLVLQGRAGELPPFADDLVATLPDDAAAWLMAARLLGSAMRQEPDAARADALGDRAVGCLRRAFALGAPRGGVPAMAELQPLRDRADYRDLVERSAK